MAQRIRSRPRATAMSAVAIRSRYADLWNHLGGWQGFMLRVALIVVTIIAASQHVLPGSSLLILLAMLVPGVLLATRAAAPLAIYALAWSAFALLRAGMDDIGLPDQGQAVAMIDRWMGGGEIPTERLQHLLYVPGAVGLLDRAAILVHTSYYVVPHGVALLLWWRSRSQATDHDFRSYLRATLVVMLLGLVLYAVVPTSPPWLEAPRDGEMTVYRITRVANSAEYRDPEQVYTYFTDPNPIAAMPSLHQALTVLLAVFLWRVRRGLGVLGIGYAIAMGFSLVYLGEHYLIDVLMGTLLTIAVVRLVVVRREGLHAEGDERNMARPGA